MRLNVIFMSSITNLSVLQLRQAANLKEEIAALENQLGQLLGSTIQPVTVKSTTAKAPKPQGGMSAAGKARIAAAQKARWAKIKAAKAVVTAPSAVKPVAAATPAKKKFSMRAEARARIAAAQKARWAKVNAAKGKPAVKPVVAPKLAAKPVSPTKPAKKQISPEGIARIRAAQKARWAKIKAAKKP